MAKRKKKNVLRCSVKTVIDVDYVDLEGFIEAHYGVDDYSVIADLECKNDSSHTVSVSGGKLDKYDTKTLNEFKSGKAEYGCSLHILMQDMCNEGVIEAGDYLINVSW